ncbi:kynurenine aminotransferase [Leptinotarsa decemlineata]|uniref:kynurenine aminotransferase n=1 Tax=Leptinotarsa decemlineata TaxID=7539 RepID=UPI003D30C5F4
MSLSLRLNDIDDEDVWKEYAKLSQEYKPVDLGLGAPDFPPTKYIRDTLAQVVSSETSVHQYTNPKGHPRLTKAFAQLYSRLIDRNIDPENEVLITSGSSEALFCSVMSLVGEGDEVILIEPYFTVYTSLIRLAGGIPKFICLKPDPRKDKLESSADFILDAKELEGLFSAKTKVIILNTPNNPLGKVFNFSELTIIAELCKKWNVTCISDEVYEWMVYKPNQHLRIASLPDMYERTITIGAAEKSFCATGWQIGWAYGPTHLMKNLQTLHKLAIYNASTPLQEAFAILLEREDARLGQNDSHFVTLERQLTEKRNFIMQKLSEAGMKPILPDGGFYVMADISKLDSFCETDDFMDLRVTKWLIKNHQLQGIPTSVFFTDQNKKKNEQFARFCFYKKEDTLQKAAEILARF